MATGYTKPGVQITQKARPSSISLLSTFRRPCIIARGNDTKKALDEAVVRSSTGDLDDLAYGSTGLVSIESVGDQVGLKNYVNGTDYQVNGNQIEWLGSSEPTSGATYFVSYTYTP